MGCHAWSLNGVNNGWRTGGWVSPMCACVDGELWPCVSLSCAAKGSQPWLG